jgi:dihydroxy-acid dehydratase
MTVTTKNGQLNKFSSHLTQVRSQVGSQAMLYGVGLTDEDMQKPQVGIVSMGWEGNTCNMHLNDLAKEVKAGVQAAGLVGLIFHTIGVSDGISMGTEGMKCSLLSRDIIADSIETVIQADQRRRTARRPAQCVPWRGCLWRHVYGQHHGFGH